MYIVKGSKKMIKIKIPGENIEQVGSFKYLGRTISSSLTVRDHYTKAIKEAVSRANALKFLTSISL